MWISSETVHLHKNRWSSSYRRVGVVRANSASECQPPSGWCIVWSSELRESTDNHGQSYVGTSRRRSKVVEPRGTATTAGDSQLGSSCSRIATNPVTIQSPRRQQ